MESMNAFLVSNINEVLFYDVDSFEEIVDCRLGIPLLESTEREPNEIISMEISNDEEFLAIISGKNLVMNEQFTNQLFIYRKTKNQYDGNDRFVLEKRVVIK